VWLITGASRGLGLGLALTRRALLRGDLVITTTRNPSRFDEVLFSDPFIDRTHVHVLTLDISSPFDSLVKTMNDAVSHWGRVDVLVSNDGSYVGMGPSEELGYVGSVLYSGEVRV
jgi:NAD(P)-dependent dehydrogenase (short-subunit alcohol dehydrogenase family)